MNKIITTYDFNSALSQQAIPILDVEEILDRRPWERGELTLEQIEILKEAKIFVKNALQGYEIISRYKNTGILVLNSTAIDAYSLAYNGLKQAGIGLPDIKRFLIKTKTTLTNIIEMKYGNDDLENNISDIYELFYHLSLISA